eukprot:1472436-Prymnesium_polylepis.2
MAIRPCHHPWSLPRPRPPHVLRLAPTTRVIGPATPSSRPVAICRPRGYPRGSRVPSECDRGVPLDCSDLPAHHTRVPAHTEPHM